MGVDVGGTFTDVVLGDSDGDVFVAKVPTTPADPRSGIERGLREVLAASGASPARVGRLVHGTTRATNVILERKGARTAFVATAGFGDMLELGREARVEADRYDLLFEKPAPPVEPALTFELDERIDARGRVVRAPAPDAVEALVRRVAAAAPEAVAICLLHAFANPTHEQLVAAALRDALPDRFVVASSEAWPEIREYERALTTVMCASVGPEMSAYLAGLESTVRALGIPCPIEVMDSSGGVLSASLAARLPIHTVESGGAAGVVAAGMIGELEGERAVISFDMGGTTAKAGVVRGGRPDVTHGFHVGGIASLAGRKGGHGFPVRIPVVDIAEIGAGGGSIAWVDAGGALRVGPQSAGAEPGPACYGRGGTEPTVTDANLVLGYLNPEALAGGVCLSPQRSAAALERAVAGPLGLSLEDAARGVHEIANINMAASIRVVTVQRGIDPRDFSLVAFGGAGPMHIARLAQSFSIPRTIVPWSAGVASAMGLLSADLSVDHVRTQLMDEADADGHAIEEIFAELESRGVAALAGEGARNRLAFSRRVDVQYKGQAFPLTVEIADTASGPELVATLAESFRRRYHDSYGIDLSLPTQFVNFRVRTTHVVDKLVLRPAEPGNSEPPEPAAERPAYFAERGGSVATPVYAWAELVPGQRLAGPAIIEGPDTTVVVPPGCEAAIDRWRSVNLTSAAPAT
ncbi:MAG: hydantoinase/oxoprolinase family protein [Deltaproteobacteria bacterium]|nr:hydantoinase/oxoprolinase family protein [Deltaproteobacteria bacterium]MBW2361752.1 hydantoinase/oxoprolinase family protein [Deltaproteobacteria bacterium]